MKKIVVPTSEQVIFVNKMIYLDEDGYCHHYDILQELAKMLTGLIKSLDQDQPTDRV